MKPRLVTPVITIAFLFALGGGQVLGQDESYPPLLEELIEETAAAELSDFDVVPAMRTRDEASFAVMRDYILQYYDGIDVESSFVLEDRVVDCVTVESQPTVRLLGLEGIEEAPDVTLPGDVEGGEPPGETESASSILTLGLEDEFGNPISCPAETVPLPRLTLEYLVRYETLADFFAKGPDGTDAIPPTPDELAPAVGANERRYAFTIERVQNFGGNSWLNLWNPDLGETGTMSISQQWYSAGDGADLQTLEGGWQVLPSKYDTDLAVLFIYWTADSYASTGCYNLDCAGFVQINNNWYLGGIWSDYSSSGGTQWGFEMQWKLYSGNWWLFLKGPGDYEAVGYYPTSVYDGGPLSEAADDILYGGETATSDRWPEMGSGEFADQGWRRAAFQNTVFYIPRDEDNGVGVWATLVEQEPNPTCYTVDLTPASSGGSWGTYFYFGGPGGPDPC